MIRPETENRKADPPAAPAVRVAYIAGTGRSGSTLLSRLLGQMDGCVSVGELRYLWERGMIDDAPCACGMSFSRCGFWTAVLARTFGSGELPDPRSLLALQRRVDRHRNIPLFVRPELCPAGLGRDIGAFRRLTAALYRSVAEVSGARVVVDSSKVPPVAFLMCDAPSVDLRVIHIVRDPRAVAHSWQRRKARLDGSDGRRFMPVFSPGRAAGRWVLTNAEMEAYKLLFPRRVLRVRYEDLARRPRPWLERIARFALGHDADPDFLQGNVAHLSPEHSFSGNPMRARVGPVVIRPDEEWRNRGAGMPRVLSLALGPMLLGYGYRP